MRLVVSNYVLDEQRSLDCHFCDDEDQADNLVTITFFDETTEVIMNVCPEHLDQMVVTALERHKAAMANNDPFWYLTEDVDPWEEEG
jgi:hypothetical protein